MERIISVFAIENEKTITTYHFPDYILSDLGYVKYSKGWIFIVFFIVFRIIN
jgi:hypothetical membrane protein